MTLTDEKLFEMILLFFDGFDEGKKYSPQEIRTAFKNIRAMLPLVPEEQFNKVKEEVEAYLLQTVDEASILTVFRDNDQNPDWYTVSDHENFFWNRYKKYLLKDKKRSPAAVDELDRITDKIMNNLADPASDLAMQKRGLLMGEVQSGKTEAYTALCNKAADCGYKVIIVLAGMTNTLRNQTQSRLDKEFAGLDSKYSLDKKAGLALKNKKVGVGKIDDDPEKIITRFTSVTKDFQISAVQSNDLNLSSFSKNGTSLFVVKKNKSILTNLQQWLTKDNEFLDVPMLLIDDEADNASVNTSDKEEATAINGLINKILKSFKQASYIGVTATPFANIFIDNEELEDRSAKDLFPRDFLVMLSVPDSYIGAKSLFGAGEAEDPNQDRKTDYQNAVIQINNDEQEDFFKYKHKMDLAFTLTSLPETLMEAVRYFILACSVEDAKGKVGNHYSMLVNVTRYTDVQNRTGDLIDEYLNGIKSSLINYSRVSFNQALKIKNIQDLKNTWDKFGFKEITGLTFKDVLQNSLAVSANRIDVQCVNQTAQKDSLDYHNYTTTGKRVIAVGGNNLSRGLTLEGLMVSYFYRNTMMYDSLLQMGRWFGYRPGYDKLFKIWMGEDSIGWFSEVSEAYYEFKNLIAQMERAGSTPREFGLRVKKSPQGLLVTARNKMRSASSITHPISISGRMIETPRLINNREVIERNNQLIEQFIQEAEDLSSSGWEYDPFVSAYICRDVPAKKLAELVGQFQSHPWNLNYNGSGLKKFLESDPDFTRWDIGIPTGKGGEPVSINLKSGKTLEFIPQGRNISEDESAKRMLKISGRHVRIGAGGAAKIGLNKGQIEEIRKLHGSKNCNDKVYLSAENRKPIALLHPVTNLSESQLDLPDVVYGIGLGFPAGKEEKRADYVVNMVELQNLLDEDQSDYFEDLD